MSNPIIEVKQGKLQGKIVENVRGGTYFSFQGIPYALPPLDKLRFKAPQPIEQWEGILDATKEGNKCYQRDLISSTECGSEDCLFLNVYTNKLPEYPEEATKAVMVWIHGGGWVIGSGNTELYGPDYLLCEDIVLVTINYRLGLFGFLCCDEPCLGVPGNAGLKDMVMALKWVDQNISKFGGDPSNVTIFGESSGGWAVHLLVLSPMGKGLFHRAIAQSGCALNPRAWGTRGVQHIAKVLCCEDKSECEVLNLLNSYSTAELFQVQQNLVDDYRADQWRPFGPVIEKPSDSSDPSNLFIDKDPLELITSGKYNKVPLMLGYVTREGMLMIARATARELEIPLINNFELYIPYYLNIPRCSNESRKIADKVKKFYFGEEEPSSKNVDSMLQLYTDVFFLRGIYAAANEHAKNWFPTYLYRFSVDGGLNIYKKISKIKHPGVAHGDELGYLFTTVLTRIPQPNSIEDVTIKRLTKLWTTFAQYGNPNPKESNQLINTTWLPFLEKETNFLDIGENLTLGKNPESLRMEFWDNIDQHT